MIVVDTNILAYMLIEGEKTHEAKRLYQFDKDWITSPLCQYEFCNVLTTHIRHNFLSISEAKELLFSLNDFLEYALRPVSFLKVVEISSHYKISGYDACFVALALENDCPLLTEDKKIQRIFPEQVFSMKDYFRITLH